MESTCTQGRNPIAIHALAQFFTSFKKPKTLVELHITENAKMNDLAGYEKIKHTFIVPKSKVKKFELKNVGV